MRNLSLKKVFFFSILAVTLVMTISLFFIREEEIFSHNNDLQKELFVFEEEFFLFINDELEELYLKNGEVDIPPEAIESLGAQALEKINDFAKEKNISSPDNSEILFRIEKLKLFVYLNVLHDYQKAENALNILPNTENKLLLINDYIQAFSFDEEEKVKRYLKTNKNWIQNMDYQTYNDFENAIFLSAPIGKNFPDYLKNYQTVSGEKINLQNKQGKIILIDFWASWCVPCLAELPYLIEAHNAYKNKGFEIISISLDEDRDTFFNFLQKWQIKWAQFFDGKGFTGKLVNDYGVKSLPTTFLLNEKGEVIEKDLSGNDLLRILHKSLK